eukprot:Nk52_evm28s2579 gene=Nk52_evmTU28s2579
MDKGSKKTNRKSSEDKGVSKDETLKKRETSGKAGGASGTSSSSNGSITQAKETMSTASCIGGKTSTLTKKEQRQGRGRSQSPLRKSSLSSPSKMTRSLPKVHGGIIKRDSHHHSRHRKKSVTGRGNNSQHHSETGGVQFGKVELRYYPRAHAGSSGVPDQGGFPLGLDFVPEGFFKSSENVNVFEDVEDFEHHQSSQGKRKGELGVVSEYKRKSIVFGTAKKPHVDVEVVQDELKELEYIRESRNHIGCECRGKGCCTAETCECFAAGIQCHEDACSCGKTTCKNPQKRYFYDLAGIDSRRTNRLKRTLYEDD